MLNQIYACSLSKRRFIQLLFVHLVLLISNSHKLNAQLPALQWAREIQGSSNEQIGELNTDAFGNLYITGVFSGTADFNPATGSSNVYNLTSSGGADGFIVKLDSQGIFQWAIALGDVGDDAIIGVDFDDSQNVIITGWITGSTDADPDTGVYLISSSPASASDIFVISYSPTAQFNWAGTMGGNFDDYASDVRAANGRIVVSGYYGGSIDLDFGSGSAVFQSNGARDGFMSVYSEAGNYLWGVSIGDVDFDYLGTLDIGADGKVFAAGQFEGTVDFDPGQGAELVSSVGYRDAFLWVLDSLGNYSAVYIYSGSGDESIGDFLVDAAGNVYLTGSFSGSMDIDPGAAVNMVTASGFDDAFTAKLSSTGNYVWSYISNGSDAESGQVIKLSPSGLLIHQTIFNADIDADPSTSTQTYTSAGNHDFLLSCTDTAGGLIWAFRIGGQYNDFGLAMVVSNNGILYSAGTFQGTVDFDPGSATVNLSAPNILYYDSFIASYLAQPTGISQNESALNQLQIFPSPSNGNYTLTNGSELITGVLVVTDISGREILQRDINAALSANFVIDDAAGVYFVTLQTNDGRNATIRIIKD